MVSRLSQKYKRTTELDTGGNWVITDQKLMRWNLTLGALKNKHFLFICHFKMPKAKDKTKRRRVQEIEVLTLIYKHLFSFSNRAILSELMGIYLDTWISLQDDHCSQSQRSGRR